MNKLKTIISLFYLSLQKHLANHLQDELTGEEEEMRKEEEIDNLQLLEEMEWKAKEQERWEKEEMEDFMRKEETICKLSPEKQKLVREFDQRKRERRGR